MSTDAENTNTLSVLSDILTDMEMPHKRLEDKIVLEHAGDDLLKELVQKEIPSMPNSAVVPSFTCSWGWTLNGSTVTFSADATGRVLANGRSICAPVVSDRADPIEDAKAKVTNDNGVLDLIAKIKSTSARVICVNAVAGSGKTTAANLLAESEPVLGMAFTKENVKLLNCETAVTCDKFIKEVYGIAWYDMTKWFALKQEVAREGRFVQFNLSELSQGITTKPMCSHARFCIIDECTLVGYNYLLLLVTTILKLYPGCKVILLGDVMQNAAIGTGPDNNEKCLLLADEIYTMNVHMRARDDKELVKMLHAFEVKDYATAYRYMETRLVENIAFEDFFRDSMVRDCIIIVGSNELLYQLLMQLANGIAKTGHPVLFENTNLRQSLFRYMPLVIGWKYRTVTDPRVVGTLVSANFNRVALQLANGKVVELERCKFQSPRTSVEGKWDTFPMVPTVVENAYIVQGMTIEHVVYVITKNMNPQQLYVALSRCRSINQLKIL